jgi:hypothetical protein
MAHRDTALVGWRELSKSEWGEVIGQRNGKKPPNKFLIS